MRWWWAVAAVGCRGYHERDEAEDTALFDCLPYTLECAECTLADDLALDGPLRVWRCEDPVEGELTGVSHRSLEAEADDEHYYGADGLRVAARRLHDAEVPVCDAETTSREEWWGAVLDCSPTCEVDPSLPQADPELPTCGG